MPAKRPTKIKALRTLRGLKAMFVAEKIGVSKSRYSDIESGKGEPKPTQLRDIASILGVKMEDLVEEVQ